MGADLIEPRRLYFIIVNRSSVCPLIFQLLLLCGVALEALVILPLLRHVRLVILQSQRLFASFLSCFGLRGQKSDIRKRFSRITEPVVLIKLIDPIAHGLDLLSLFVFLYLFQVAWGE